MNKRIYNKIGGKKVDERNVFVDGEPAGGFLNDEVWKQARQSIVVACADILPIVPAERRNVLLVKRGPKESFAGHWWVIGGRAKPNESPEQTALRRATAETGIEWEIIGSLGIFRTSCPIVTTWQEVFWGFPKMGSPEIKIDQTSTEWGLFFPTELPKNIHPYIKRLIKVALQKGAFE